MQNKNIKKGVGPDVQPVGSFLANLVFEAARRIIRNGERINMLMEEFQERFKLDTRDVYTLLSELQKLGIDVTPNEWLYFTPVENRVAFLQTMVKNAKVYGSRYEDIVEAIGDLNAEIMDTKKWLKEHEADRQLNPQTYVQYYDKLPVLEKNKVKLEETKKLALASTVYDASYGSGIKPLTILNYAIGNDVFAILKTATDDIVQSPITDLMIKSALDTAMDSEDEPETKSISLKRSFDQLKGDTALQPYFNQFKQLQNSDFDSPEVVASNVNALLEFIDNSGELKETTDEEQNDAYKAIKTFLDAREDEGLKLETNIDEYLDESIMQSEDMPAGVNDAVEPGNEQTGEFAPEATPGGVPPVQEEALPKAASYTIPIKHASDKDIASAMLFIDKIARLLNTVQESETIPKTAHVNTAIESIQQSLFNIKSYVQENLPHNGASEKKAALIVLSNINKKLSSLIDIYTDVKSEDEFMKYVVSSDILSVLKSTNTLLSTIGD